MSEIVWKHEAPRLCRIRRALFGASPSAVLGRCTFGLRHGCRACKGCEHNVTELMQEGFEEVKRIRAHAQAKLTEMGLPAQSLEISAVDLAALPDGTDLNDLAALGVYILGYDGKYSPHTFDGEKWVPIPDHLTPVEEAEPPEPPTMTPTQRSEALAEDCKELAQVIAEAARAIREWAAKYTDVMEELREAVKNAVEKPPRVNKRPDYSQSPKACTKGKIKRIRTRRSREKK